MLNWFKRIIKSYIELLKIAPDETERRINKLKELNKKK